MRAWRGLLVALAAAGLAAQQPPDGDLPVFGTTVVIPFGLKGNIYDLTPDAYQLPKFEKLEPVGTIYTTMLNIPPRSFNSGFPGVTKRFEWFAIDYRGRFYVNRPGRYDFTLISDDGSKLYIDDKLLIDNDGLHPTASQTGSVKLAGGIHRIRVSYFQGPRDVLALILAVSGPGDKQPHIFSTDDYKPPVNPADWKYGSPDDLNEPEPPAPEPPGKKKRRDR
jgi:hypothetical protein